MHRYSLLEYILFPPAFVNKNKLRSRLNGKTLLITGASSGIGEQLAYQLADHHVHLILVARTTEKLYQMKVEIEKQKARVSVYPADLRNEKELDGLTTFIGRIPGGLDFFINNAGKSIRRSIFASLDRYHDFTRTMAINYFAPVHLMLDILPILQKNKGYVINISSTSSLLLPIAGWAAYLASKSAFDAWFRSVSPELNATGIQTTTIYFPLVKTPMILPTPEYRNAPGMSPEQAAKAICRAIAGHKRAYKPWWLIFGQITSVVFRGIYECHAAITQKRRKKDNNR